ncbi:glycosyltransferase family 4 protein [Aurantiacibacter xanthus]|uniref:Glycosyltransferase family 4 protein n=1 Tax=Aurantiacibacter xanthus TaxID=1784712 RepID=A0A3A1PJP0_9SPHN|nr:glycosyltransferase [Aurantiacibacter xanthus]RIV93480.1 glycosyltransferase family 4 protein [Aurantiacibacter xanthus]
MKRVLSLATLYPNAQQPRFGTFVARQMEALAARGDWEVTIINPIGVPPVPMGRYRALAQAAKSGHEGGVEVFRPRFTLIPSVGGPFNPAMIVRAALPIARRLHARAPFDLVDAQFFYPDGPAAARIAEDLGLPLSIKARGADISHWGKKAYANRKMRAAAEQASGLLAVCDMLANDMADIGLPRDKITVHYTGLDRSLFRPLNRAESRTYLASHFGITLDPGARLVASIGALIPRKGQHFVIRALAQLPDTHLALVGIGPDRAALAELAQELGLTERVHFLGSLGHGDLPRVLSAADATALPSASEGLANAWVESLACGTPLVITDVGGAREILSADVSPAGRIVARDADAIAQALGQLFAEATPPAVVSQSAARFSWEANAAALASYYERLIA